MPTCLIGLGANLNDRRATLDAAVARLAECDNLLITARSRWLANRPIGGPAGQGEFLNGVIRAETSIEPEELLRRLQQIEDEFGRRRAVRWDARTLDLDLLLYDQLEIATRPLLLPHPRMAFRRFVLEPACEVAADMVHPTTGWTIERLLGHLQNAPCYVAITGAPGTGKTALASRLAESVPAHLIADPADGPRTESASDVRPGQPTPLAVELQRLEQRTSQLAAVGCPEPDQTVVSDFWLEQSVAYAATEMESDDLATMETALRHAQSRVLSPKLVIVLLGASPSTRQREVHTAIARRARAVECCPRLLLPSDDPQASYDEARAAIEAMR